MAGRHAAATVFRLCTHKMHPLLNKRLQYNKAISGGIKVMKECNLQILSHSDHLSVFSRYPIDLAGIRLCSVIALNQE